MDLTDLMAEDSSLPRSLTPNDEDLQTVADLARKQLDLEKLVEQTESLLKDSKEQLARVRELDLPSALEKFGLAQIKLLDGSSVTIKEEVYAGITEDHRIDAFKWLEETGNDGIIKNEVKCPFSKGQDSDAKSLVGLLTREGFSFTNSRSVHPQTLRAFVKDRIKGGEPVPMELFSVHVKKVATIKSPK